MKSLFDEIEVIDTLIERENDILLRCEALFESTYNEFLHNKEMIELEVMESGQSFHEQIMLEEENAVTFKDKVKSILIKIRETIVNVCRAVAAKIRNFFGSKTVDEAIKEAEAQAKSNPELRNKKVEIPDVERRNREIEKDIDDVDKIRAKFRSGKYDAEDKAKLEEIENRRKKRIGIGAAVLITVPIITALGLAKSFAKKKAKDLDQTASNGGNIKDDIDVEKSTPQDIDDYVEADRIRANLENENAKNAADSIKIVRIVKDAITKVKKKITGEKDVDPNLDGPTKESADELLESIIADVDEKYNNRSDAEKYLDLMEAEIFGLEEPDGMTAEEYLEEMNDDLFTDVPNYNRMQSSKLAESLHL